MKFSSNLLSDTEIRNKLFKSGVEKSQELLTLIFGLDFNSQDTNIINVDKQPEQFTYTVSFLYHGRTLTASYGLQPEGLLESEILSVAETDKEIVTLENATDSFSSNVNLIIEYLEKRFDLNFTPFDPGEDDKNILEINFDEREQVWQTIFLTECFEGKVIAAYMLTEKQKQTLQLTYLKNHIIIFD